MNGNMPRAGQGIGEVDAQFLEATIKPMTGFASCRVLAAAVVLVAATISARTALEMHLAHLGQDWQYEMVAITASSPAMAPNLPVDVRDAVINGSRGGAYYLVRFHRIHAWRNVLLRVSLAGLAGAAYGALAMIRPKRASAPSPS
jgi:hypothetical protein